MIGLLKYLKLYLISIIIYIKILLLKMSISPLHGGLVFQEDLQKPQATNSQYEEVKTSSKNSTNGTDLNTRDINEFFNPRPSDLSLDERVKLCLSVGEEVI
jgi:hypothetical protein